MTAAQTPGHLPALDDNPMVRADGYALVTRMVEHAKVTSTDCAPGQWREPVANYCDPELWASEIDSIHRCVPLPLALSCELPTPGMYKALEVVGTPVLITRTQAGDAKAMVNACRHRGAELVPAGLGTVKRLTCPFHSWCYDLTGRLAAVEEARTFGDLDRNDMGLVQLPAAERAGLIFVGLTPGRPIDLDSWLGPELGQLLDALDLESCHHHCTRELEGPNWKIVVDGYLESYHVGTAHRDSVLQTHLSNVATFDALGPHMRNSFALRGISEVVDQPVDPSALPAVISVVYWLFPGLSISGGWRDQVTVSLVLPGRSWDVSVTQQHTVLRRPPIDDVTRQALDRSADRLQEIVLSEDHASAYGIQRGLPAMSGTVFTFGRNEPGVQHFHQALADLMGRPAPV